MKSDGGKAKTQQERTRKPATLGQVLGGPFTRRRAVLTTGLGVMSYADIAAMRGGGGAGADVKEPD